MIESYNPRRKCCVSGCNKFGRNKGFYKGKTIYGNTCEIHHRSNKSGFGLYWRIRRIENNICENCGWDKAYCDRHRVDPAKGYAEGNVKILCPNCHRLATLGILTFAKNETISL